MDDVQITVRTVLAICGGISVLGGTVAVIARMLNPFKKIKDHQERMSGYLENDNRRIAALEEGIAESKECDRVLARGILALLNHAITNNSIDNLKNAQKEIQEYLIEK